MSDDLQSWEATTKLMKMGKKTLQRTIDLIFKLTSEMFDMGRFPSRHGCPWDKLIRTQDLAIAIQQRYVATKASIELVLEASKKAIPDSIEKLCVYEKLMRNYLDMHERSSWFNLLAERFDRGHAFEGMDRKHAKGGCGEVIP